MTVLYQAKGSAATADASFHDRGTTAATSNRSSGFFNKHIRLVDALPSEAKMIQTVQEIWDDRMKSPATMVASPQGELRKKKDLYGKIKPPGNTTLFVTRGGFESLNAYIEQEVNDSGDHWVPILGGGVVVTRVKDKASGVVDTQVYRTGYWEISVEVGGATAISSGSVRSKVVYHFGGAERSMSDILRHSGVAPGF